MSRERWPERHGGHAVSTRQICRGSAAFELAKQSVPDQSRRLLQLGVDVPSPGSNAKDTKMMETAEALYNSA